VTDGAAIPAEACKKGAIPAYELDASKGLVIFRLRVQEHSQNDAWAAHGIAAYAAYLPTSRHPAQPHSHKGQLSDELCGVLGRKLSILK
jgi:hypothetical protein